MQAVGAAGNIWALKVEGGNLKVFNSCGNLSNWSQALKRVQYHRPGYNSGVVNIEYQQSPEAAKLKGVVKQAIEG